MKVFLTPPGLLPFLAALFSLSLFFGVCACGSRIVIVEEAMDWLRESPTMSFISSFLIPLALLFVLSVRRRRKLPFPPRPRQLPIIGNILMMDQLTHRSFANLADKYGSLCHLRLGYLHAFAVSMLEMAREVLQVRDNAFSNRPATIAIAYLTYDRADMAFSHYGSF